MVREVVQRKRRQKKGDGAATSGSREDGTTVTAPVAQSESDEKTNNNNENSVEMVGTGKDIITQQKDDEEEQKVKPSTGKAPSTRQLNKIQNRKSIQHSPYRSSLTIPSKTTTNDESNNGINSIIPSPHTPLRTPRSITTKRHDLWNSPLSPKSPSMRAYHTLVSFISPRLATTTRQSAAFGQSSVDGTPERSEVWKGKQKEEQLSESKDTDERDEDDVVSQLYPPLPSDPNMSTQMIIGSPPNSESQDTTKDLLSIIEQTIDEIEEDDDTRNSEEEEERERKEEQEIVDERQQVTQNEDDILKEPKTSEEDDVVITKENIRHENTAETYSPAAQPTSRGFNFLSTLKTNLTFGAPSAIGLSSSQEQPSSSTNSAPEPASSSTLPPARSPFQSNGFVAPRLPTPSKMGFGAIASDPMQPEEAIFGEAESNSKSFTFGNSQENNVPRLPQFPRLSARPTRNISPLAKNYALLARFFTEKAEQETRAEAPTSTDSIEDEGNETNGALTEIELAGCMRLIEQSYAQGQGTEIERLRLEALQRGQMGSREEDHNRMDEDEVHFANSHIGQGRRSFLSRSPSLPLGAAAGELPVGGHFGYHSRPSNSFLAPSYRTPEDLRVNRSLANTFGPVRNTANVASKRKHRPLYLGPGVGARATSSILSRTQQSQARRSALVSQRATQQALLQPISAQAGKEGELDSENNDGPRKRRKLPETPTSKPSVVEPTVEPSQPSKSMTPARTATADAMLSILSSGPSIPSRSTAATKSQPVVNGLNEANAVSNPAVVNPYETRSRLSRRSNMTDSNTSTFSSSAATKEKERLKQERENRQKAIKEREARKESTLDFIKRTAPTASPIRRGRQIRLEEDDDDEDEDEEEGAEEQESERAAELKEQEKKAANEEARKRKNEELKRRTELLTKKAADSKPAANTSEKGMSVSQSNSKEDQPSISTTNEVKSSIPASKSFTFNSAFAPKKPSPLSQPTAPDSPSASSESSERSTFKSFIAAPAKEAKGDEKKDKDAEEIPTQKAPLFSFGGKGPTEEANKASTASKPLFSFGSSKPAESNASTTTTASIPLATTTPFTFNKPSTTEVVAKPVVTSDSSSDNKKILSAREQASLIPSSDLPKFDFALEVVVANNGKSATTEIDEATKKSASSIDVQSLPKFDFGITSTQLQSTTASTNENQVKSTSPFSFSVSKPNSTPSQGFSFKAIPSTSSGTTTTPQASGKGSNDNSNETTSGTGGGSENDTSGNSNAAGKSTSALLSGVGEGEEEEDTIQESRCKIWSLSNGKWTDLGIGSLKIKKHKETSKRRVLVRNEGNGKVTVNFNILSSFKPNQEKNFVTFLGFDSLGKPTNYRCKIKTEEGAKELKEALEKSAKEAVVA